MSKPETDTPAPLPPPPVPDFVQLGHILMDASQRAQPLLQEFFEKYDLGKLPLTGDPLHMREIYAELMGNMISNPQQLIDSQVRFWSDWTQLWSESAKRFLGQSGETLYEPDKADKRFKSPLWQQSAYFDFIKQSYLLTSRWLEKLVQDTEGLTPETRQKLDFYTRQFINAMSPTNFLLTNPEVLEETVNTRGENLIKGLHNLIEDLERGGGELNISTTDYKAFKLGENIATTPGKIVYQNELMQLIQYEPATEKVCKRPLLIVPPWINKYYILDLKPENSLIKWLVGNGHTVFIVSWVNPDKDLARKHFEDYMQEGILDALDQIEIATGEKDANVMGYCLGGTLLAVTLAWLHERGQASRVASATFLTTLVDFEHAGEMKLFMDEHQLEMMDQDMEEKGYLSADALKKTFSLLRANDMIWSFVVNNYLMGREPFPFDLLYWNDDSTNMPAAMHSFYLRRFYRDNALVTPCSVEMRGTPIDIRKIETPCYFLSTREDHIAPWKATYATTQMISGDKVFVLAASGHVAGVVNPPGKKKYCYWLNGNTPPSPDDWLQRAGQHEGSWWPHHLQWLQSFGNGETGARDISNALEDAPGSYVKMKAPTN
ncbi:MAG: class I poly(R)-hydroxyalkanoic acid synthase [Micavibrio aeruginosavorus]|uniref:Class I poly(R)-hydroxyalkanoic acid synthase n=1 Tax=Micavibrio aeruginosavorus TaxID=349221 RepID=A0A7T5R0F0_9BACT|nr:MAG: class I poly(R)-hydroxyalkanoic acid synthase [Micavibrio aeruginosavorus]